LGNIGKPHIGGTTGVATGVVPGVAPGVAPEVAPEVVEVDGGVPEAVCEVVALAGCCRPVNSWLKSIFWNKLGAVLAVVEVPDWGVPEPEVDVPEDPEVPDWG
jgi:hypothetical protein